MAQRILCFENIDVSKVIVCSYNYQQQEFAVTAGDLSSLNLDRLPSPQCSFTMSIKRTPLSTSVVRFAAQSKLRGMIEKAHGDIGQPVISSIVDCISQSLISDSLDMDDNKIFTQSIVALGAGEFTVL